MENKVQHRSVMIAVAVFAVAVLIVGVLGFLTIGTQEDFVQGQIDVEEYRVSSKVPSRVLELRVKEGDYVHVGDTLAILDAPEVQAKKMQAVSAEDAAAAMSDMARNGARQEQVHGAYELWQQAKAGLDIHKKSYERVQRLYDEGVVSEQKRDEAYAGYKAFEAQERAAKSQYDMAVNGARAEE
jgi:HlyD family secretion protein